MKQINTDEDKLFFFEADEYVMAKNHGPCTIYYNAHEYPANEQGIKENLYPILSGEEFAAELDKGDSLYFTALDEGHIQILRFKRSGTKIKKTSCLFKFRGTVKVDAE